MNLTLKLLDADDAPVIASPPAALHEQEAGADALRLLARDQRRIMALIERYRSGADNANKLRISDEACARLSVHILVEEELLFPLLRTEPGHEAALEEAEIGHYVIKQLIRQLQDEDLRVHRRDAVFGVLADYVQQHFHEEREVLFAALARIPADLVALARGIVAAKRRVEPWFSIAYERPEPPQDD